MKIKPLAYASVLVLCIALWPCLVVTASAEEEGAVVVQGAQEEAKASAVHESVGPATEEVKVKEEGAAHGEGHGEAGGAEEEHGITHGQIMNFIWQCLNFAILVAVLFKFLKEPISNALKGRTEEIQKTFSDLEEKKREAELRYAEYEKKLSQIDKEAERILKTFIKQGEVEKEKIIKQAKESAERIKAQAGLYVQHELDKAKKELQKEIADLAVQMAEDIIRKNLNEQDHHKLISEYLEKVVTKN